MSEHIGCEHDPTMPEAFQPYIFIGSKLANVLSHGMPRSEGLGEEAQVALTNVLATCLSSGILLGLQEKDEQAIQAQVEALQEQAATAKSEALTAAIPALVMRGISFYRGQIADKPSLQVQSWLKEYELLRSAET